MTAKSLILCLLIMHDVLNVNIKAVGLYGSKTINYLLIYLLKHYNEQGWQGWDYYVISEL